MVHVCIDILMLLLQVSTNGAISFTRPISTYNSNQFPLRDNKEIIAPFWADVDTTGIGGISYRETTDRELLSRADEDIKIAFPKSAGFSSTYLFIATWNRVGYFESRTDKVYYVQCIVSVCNSSQCCSSYYKMEERF